jgi:hypothetical protein
MPAERSRRSGAKGEAKDLHVVAGDQGDSPPSPDPQSYGGDTLTDGEKAFIDFLIDKAIEAWRKR